jgi:CHASE3 domain sensor protein
MAEVDVKRIVGELASRHGIRLDVNDPAISIVLVNRLVLEHSTDELVAGIRASMDEFEEAVRKVQTRAGQLVAAEFNDRVGAIRSELQRDIALAGARANEIVYRAEQANRHPVMLRWAVVGTLAALALFLMGLWIGARYMHV